MTEFKTLTKFHGNTHFFPHVLDKEECLSSEVDEEKDTHTIVYIYIYIYIYIYSHPQSDGFVVSQHFSVARAARCFKPILKPGWHQISRISYSRAIIILSIIKGIFFFYIYVIGSQSAQFMRRAIAFQRIWKPVNSHFRAQSTG